MRAGDRVELGVQHEHAGLGVLEHASRPLLLLPVTDRLPVIARQLVLLALDRASQLVIGLRLGRLHQLPLVDRPLRRRPGDQPSMIGGHLPQRQSLRRSRQTGQPLGRLHITMGRRRRRPQHLPNRTLGRAGAVPAGQLGQRHSLERRQSGLGPADQPHPLPKLNT